jgi:hypothetical protein
MKALQMEVTCREWWGEERWADSRPFVIGTVIQDDTSGLPNAPVCIYVMTADPMEAAQLLRLAADHLERNHSLLDQLERERDATRYHPDSDNEEIQF